VVTTGDQIYNGAVVLGANTTLSGNTSRSAHGELRRDGRSLTVNSNNGSFTLGGEVGTTSALSRCRRRERHVVNGNVNTTADINLTSAGLLT